MNSLREFAEGLGDLVGVDQFEAVMMAEWADRAAVGTAGSALQFLLEDSRSGAIREKPEGSDRGPEEHHNRGTDGRRQVHQPGVAGHRGTSPPEESGGPLDVEEPRSTRRPISAGFGKAACDGLFVGPAEDDDIALRVDQEANQLMPVSFRPTLRCVAGTWCDGDQRSIAGERRFLEEAVGSLGGFSVNEDLRRPAVGPDIEPPSGIEIPFDHRPCITVDILFGANEYRSLKPMLGVSGPAPSRQYAQSPRAQALVEV